MLPSPCLTLGRLDSRPCGSNSVIMVSLNNLVIGADNHVGAYLARLLAARGERVGVTGDRLLAPLGIVDDVEPLNEAEALARVGRSDIVYFVEDDDIRAQTLFPELLAAVAKAASGPRLINIVDRAMVEDRAGPRGRVRDLVVRRSEAGLNAANALLHRHDSRLGPTDTLPARIVGHLAAAKGQPGSPPLAIDDTGPEDWGWTAEYVDAIQRMARLSRPVDLQIATGHRMSVQDMIAYAGEWFGIDPTGLFAITTEPARPEQTAPDLTRLKAMTGWAAGTWGRDLVRTLAEGRTG